MADSAAAVEDVEGEADSAAGIDSEPDVTSAGDGMVDASPSESTQDSKPVTEGVDD